MILLVLLWQLYDISATQMVDKTIYLTEGEDYKVNLDSIFKEDKYENTYSFRSSNKGFAIDESSLKLKSDQGAYSILPTKILRERQLINLDDYQGQGQFGILDQHDSGHRICYNNDSMINLDQCIELDSSATSYDFVFIDRNAVAVSMVRVSDQQFGVKIYQDKEQISELFFIPSKTYTQLTKSIIEYCEFGQQKYLMFGVTEQDSNVELLQILDNFEVVNTKNIIDQQLMPNNQTLQYLVCDSTEQAKIILSFISQDFRAFELGYNFISHSVAQTYLRCQQDSYKISSNDIFIFNNFTQQIKSNAQVKYTLNYLIVLQDNKVMVTALQKSAQRASDIDGIILKIDVDFQNDILIVFTDTKIVTYYLKQATLSYSSNKITDMDLVTILAQSGQSEQIANIHFQVLSKVDYNPYLLKDLTQDLYYNRLFNTTFDVPLQGISGADIQVDGKVNDQVQLIPKNQDRYGLWSRDRKMKIIQEYLMTNDYRNPYLFRQFEDFTYFLQVCELHFNSHYQCFETIFTGQPQQKVTLQFVQGANKVIKFAFLDYDGLEIQIVYKNSELLNFKIIKTSQDNQFVDLKVGTDRLFVYTINYLIQIYYFPSGKFINQFSLSQFGLPKGEQIRKLWVNLAKTNLIAITYGEDLILGRFTTQFIFIQRFTIKWVVDVNIIADNKFTVLSTDKTNQKLTQYIIENGKISIDRELDTHGYQITGEIILSNQVFGETMIQGQQGPQNAILVFMDTELARDSLVKVIQLQDDEFPANVIYHKKLQKLLIRSTDQQKNSSIMHLSYTYQDFQTNLTSVPNKFSQLLNLKYVYGSSFSNKKIESNKHFYLEYQFYYITVKQSQNNITYENEVQLKIPIKPDTFQGQVRMISKTYGDANVKLTTRFNNLNEFSLMVFQCKQVFSFQRIICLAGNQVIYLNNNGEIISQLNITITEQSTLIQIILNDDDNFALIRSIEDHLLLIYISENNIERSNEMKQQWNCTFNVSIFYKKWLVVFDKTKLIYFKLQIEENDLWSLEQQYEYLISGIQVIQYDPITEQLFYTIGDQNIYYFNSSLEGETINKQFQQQSFNLYLVLKSLNVFQVNVVIQNIKITTYKKSYLLVSTSYCNIWNITIKSATQDFQVNNMFIVNERYPNERYPIVQDIQQIDDYVLVQTFHFQSLYKNTFDQQMDKPYLSLEGIPGSKFMGLFKNGSQIIHFFIDDSGYYLQQTNIDEDVYLTVNLTSYTPGNITINAINDFQWAQVNYQFIQEVKIQKSYFSYFLLIAAIVVLSLAIGLYCYRRNRQQVRHLIEEIEIEYV